MARLGLFDDLVPQAGRATAFQIPGGSPSPAPGTRIGMFDDLIPRAGIGGLPEEATPLDYASQSMSADQARFGGPQPMRMGTSGAPLIPPPPAENMEPEIAPPAPQDTPEGRFAELRATANQQLMDVQAEPRNEPTTMLGKIGQAAGNAYTGTFGGHDPIGEIFDRVITPFLPGPDGSTPEEQQWLDNRGFGERAADTAAFAASMPVRAFTRGEYGAGDIASGLGFPGAGESIAAGEADFARANESQLGAVADVGGAILGATGASMTPMLPPRGQRYAPRAEREAPAPRVEPTFNGAPPPQAAATPGPTPTLPPQTRQLPQTQPHILPPAPQAQPGVSAFGQPASPIGPGPQTMSMPGSGVARARQYVRTLDDLGMPRFGPAIAQAAREGEGMGTLTRMVQNVPLAGRPIERGGVDFYNAATRAADDIAGRYSQSGNPEAAGGTARAYFDRFKNNHSIDRDDLASMPDAEVRQLASMPPRDVGSLKTATAARYEQAWRNIPEERRLGRSFEGEPRLTGDMPETRAVLKDIHDSNVRMMNKGRLARRKVDDETPDELPTRQEAMHKMAIPFRGGVIGSAIEDILAGNWKGSLQTMRDIRSGIRRMNSKVADNEGNVLSKAQLERIYGAISRDMDDLMVRVSRQFRENGNISEAQRFEAARRDMKAADRFTRRYAEAMEKIKSITSSTRDMDVLQKIHSAAQAGNKANTDMLLQIRRMAPDEVLDDIAAGMLNYIGQPTGRAGQAAQEAGFSLGKATAQWNSMGARQRQLIWGHRPQVYKRLNDFFKVAEGMAEYEKMINTSKSGQHVIAALASAGLLTTIFGSIAGFGKALAVGAGVYGTAKFLTSPLYVAWLTRTVNLQKTLNKMTPQAAVAAATRQKRSLVTIIREDASLDPAVRDQMLSALEEGASQAPRAIGASNAPENGDRSSIQ